MEQSDVLRVGIAGCGNQGRNLAEAVSRIPTMHLVAVADPVTEAAATVARLAPDVHTYSSVEQLLRTNEVDALLVATPHHVLQPVALAAVRAGKHVMAEKPIALNARQAAALQEAVAQKNVCYLSGYSFRFSFGKYLRVLLDAGVVGEIQAMLGSIGVPPLDEGWIASPETGGGPLQFVGSHLVDLALWYADDTPIEARADLRRRADTGADDTAALQLRFARGATAQLLVTQSAPTFFFAFEIIGRSGRIQLRGWNFLQFEIEAISTVVPAYAQPTTVRPRIFRDNISAMFVPELQEFAAAIREQRQPTVTVQEGRQVLSVLDAALASAESGKAVSL